MQGLLRLFQTNSPFVLANFSFVLRHVTFPLHFFAPFLGFLSPFLSLFPFVFPLFSLVSTFFCFYPAFFISRFSHLNCAHFLRFRALFFDNATFLFAKSVPGRITFFTSLSVASTLLTSPIRSHTKPYEFSGAK